MVSGKCCGCKKEIVGEELTYHDYVVRYAQVGHDPSYVQGRYIVTETGKTWHGECYFKED